MGKRLISFQSCNVGGLLKGLCAFGSHINLLPSTFQASQQSQRTALLKRLPEEQLEAMGPTGLGLGGSSVHGILQARILGWVAIPLSRGSSQPRDGTQVFCIAGRFFII